MRWSGPARSVTLGAIVTTLACSGPDRPLLTADVPLRLETHLDAARVTGSEIPTSVPPMIEWDFGVDSSDWIPVVPLPPGSEAVAPEAIDDGLRLSLSSSHRVPGFGRLGLVAAEVGPLSMEDWDRVEVRARTTTAGSQIGLLFNHTTDDPVSPQLPFANIGAIQPLTADGTIQAYEFPLGASFWRQWAGEWTHLGIGVTAGPEADASIDILSVRLVPKALAYAEAGVGTRPDTREFRYGRQALYTHTPSRLEFEVSVPGDGRFTTGLGVIRSDVPVSFVVSVHEGAAEPVIVLDGVVTDASALNERAADLSAFAGRAMTLVLETRSEQPGTVALWGAPTVSAASATHDADGGLIDLPAHRLLTSEPGASDWGVVFSPDGTELLFSRTDLRADRTWLALVPTDGGDVRRFSPPDLPVDASRISWSRADGRVAFTGFDDDGSASLWLQAGEGAAAGPLDLDEVSDQVFYPSWYPDGRRLVVVDYGGGNGGVLKRIDTAAGTVEPLTDRAEVLAGKPSVSPDGLAIAFAGQRSDGSYDQTQNRIWLLDDDGLREMDALQGRAPAWSPDGRWVVFESDRGSPNGNYAVFALPREGGPALQLTSYGIHVNHPSWSPRGDVVAFSAIERPGGQWRIALVEALVR